FLIPVYILDDAYNLAIRAENQLAKRTRPSVFSSRNNSLSIQSTSKPESSQYGSKSAALDKKKQPVNTSTVISKSTNPYDRPIVGKCFKCGLPGHRSSDCRATGRKVNLTLKEDEYDEEEENDEDSDDSGSTENIVSRDIVQRLKLPTEKHPNPYRIGRIKSVGEINVTERCKVPFTIGKYKEEVICDMDACHVLLGRPWEFDVNATRKGKYNTYSFRLNGVKKILVPLIENSKPKVLEEKRNNLMIMSHRDFEDEIKGESVIYAVVAT
ncbi:reverse transcriptase domain-containing protein, partial [Tanacetum coccineum]